MNKRGWRFIAVVEKVSAPVRLRYDNLVRIWAVGEWLV
jgi:hypothetical protein